MTTFSIIQKSQLEGAMRLDAEYYQPEFLKRKKDLNDYPGIVCLKEIASVKTGPAYSSEKINDDFEIPLARIGDVTNKNDTGNWLKLSKDEFEKFHSNKVSDDDILMAMTGDPPDVGKVNLITNKENSILAFNQRVAKLHSKTKSISNKFLFAYLSTEYSRFQAERAALGIRQRNLGIKDLRDILVITPVSAEDTERLVSCYQNELQKSKNTYRQAENFLLEELGLSTFAEDTADKKDLFSVVNFSDILEERRIDAEYFQPKYEKLISRIESQNRKRLGDLVSMKKGVEIGAEQYQDEGKLFIRVSSMGKFEINGSDQKYLSEKLYEKLKSDFQPQVGEILLTKDATPGIAYVLKENIEGIISGGTLRLKLTEKIEGEYLALCLNSIIGQMQAERDAGGSVIAHWKPEQIKNVVIPILSTEIQQKIADLVRESHEARKKSKDLSEEAKRKVEEMIEKGGEKNGKI